MNDGWEAKHAEQAMSEKPINLMDAEVAEEVERLKRGKDEVLAERRKHPNRVAGRSESGAGRPGVGTKVVQFSDSESVYKGRIPVGVSVEASDNENGKTRLGPHFLDDGSEDSLPPVPTPTRGLRPLPQVHIEHQERTSRRRKYE